MCVRVCERERERERRREREAYKSERGAANIGLANFHLYLCRFSTNVYYYVDMMVAAAVEGETVAGHLVQAP